MTSIALPLLLSGCGGSWLAGFGDVDDGVWLTCGASAAAVLWSGPRCPPTRGLAEPASDDVRRAQACQTLSALTVCGGDLPVDALSSRLLDARADQLWLGLRDGPGVGDLATDVRGQRTFCHGPEADDASLSLGGVPSDRVDVRLLEQSSGTSTVDIAFIGVGMGDGARGDQQASIYGSATLSDCP